MVSKRKILKKKPKDPRCPKRPANSFGFFLRDNQAAALNSPLMRRYRQAMVLKVAGKMWRKSSPEVKKKAIRLASQSKKRYLIQRSKYKPPTAEQWQHIVNNWPKRFRVNYNFFVMDVFRNIWRANHGSGFGDVSRMVAKRWRKMSDKEKKPYNQRYQKDRKRHQREVKALWASIH
jgi:hypothetical protein